MSSSRLVFVTDRADAHVARFDRLFRTLSSSYELLTFAPQPSGKLVSESTGHTFESWSELSAYLESTADVVVSGPLDTVSAGLTGGKFRHVGISWATDLMVTAAESPAHLEQLSKTVRSLRLVVTDNYAIENALVAMGVREETIVRIPWGAEAQEGTFSAQELAGVRSRFRIPATRRIILYPRSLEPHYDPEMFIQAFSIVAQRHSDALAILVESGSLVPRVKDMIRAEGLDGQVQFVPLQKPHEFVDLLHLADVVVVTPRTDGTSVTVMEAMQAGVPVVSSLTSGSAEWVIQGITGWTFPVGDVAGLAAALEQCLNCPSEEREPVLSNARHLVTTRAGWPRSAAILTDALGALL